MFKKFVIALVVSGFLVQTTAAYAHPGPGPGPGPGWHGGPGWRGGPGWGWGGGPRPGFPYLPVIFGGLTFLYCAGLYYQSTASGYVVVNPPTGMVVPSLPVGYTVVYANGVAYYQYGSVYYTLTPSGYVVVNPPPTVIVQPAPVVVQQPAPVVIQQQQPVVVNNNTVAAPAPAPAPTPAPTPAPAPAPAAKTSDNYYDVHVSNGDGSYMLVRLTKTDKGFLGPQGEFYPDHPTEDQLKARYGRR